MKRFALRVVGAGLLTVVIASGFGHTMKPATRGDMAQIVVGAVAVSPGCCLKEWRKGCANETMFGCRVLTAVPPECAAATDYTWLWCLQAVCDPVQDHGEQVCQLENNTTYDGANKKRCSNGCRAKGTLTATDCPAGEQKCAYDMYTYDNRVCPNGACPGGPGTGTGTIDELDHCAAIQVCKRDNTLMSDFCADARQRGSLCN